MKRMSLVLVAAFVAAVAACGGAPLVKDKIGDDPGGLLYNGYTKPEANCYHCHGGDGHGSMLGPDLAKAIPKMSDGEIANVIANGRPKTIMEPYKGKLTDAEIQQLVAWLKKEFPGSPSDTTKPADTAAPPSAPSTPAPSSATPAPSSATPAPSSATPAPK